MGRTGFGTAYPDPLALTSTTTLLCADFDNDKRAEVVVGRSGGEVVRYLGSASGGLTSSLQVAALGSSVSTLSSGDINSDGAPDLVVGLANGQIWALRGLGTGAFAPAILVATAQSVPQVAILRDLNADGKPDLALAGTTQLEILPGNGAGGFSASFGFYGTTSSSYGLVTADFNNDGKPDLTTLNSAANQVVTLLGSAFGQSLVTTLNSILAVGAGDFDGDGKADLAVMTNAGQARFNPLWGDGLGGFTVDPSIVPGEFGVGQAMTTGLLNGDRLPDVCMGSEFYIYAFFSRGARLFNNCTYRTTFAPKVAVANADVTGDGIVDMIWATSAELGVLPGI